MKPSIWRSERGFGLIIVLAAVLGTGSLGTYMLGEIGRTVRESGRARDELKAYWLARAGVEWVRSAPLGETAKSGQDFWKPWAVVRRRAFRGGFISVKVVDESSRLSLAKPMRVTPGEGPLEATERLLKSVGLPVALAEKMFPDALVESGGDSAERPPYVTAGELSRLVGAPSLWKRLAPYVTVVTDGKINVNRAGREVLAALIPEGGDAAAAVILAGRSTAPIASTAALKKLLSESGVAVPAGALAKMTVKSEIVTVWSVGEFAGHSQGVAATLQWRRKKGWFITSFRASGRPQGLEDVAEGF